MAVYSGTGGTATGGGSSSQITSWSFNPTSNNSAWGSSSTNGYKDRVVGVKDGSGSIEGKWDGSQAMVEGSEYTLVLTANTGAFTVAAVIDSFSVEVDIDDGEVVRWSAEFSINGSWSVA